MATLTTLFLGFYFLAATQDIAVDGLALTILSPKNKELGATCNAIGQSVGFFLACTPAPSPCPARARPSLSCSDAHAPLALEAARQPARRRGHLAGPARAHARLALLMTAVWIMDHLIESRTAAK